MTAEQLLEQVETQFQVMYLHRDQKEALLTQALRTCQNKMGPFTSIVFDGPEVDTPADFLSVAVAMDVNGRWQEVERVQVSGSDKLRVKGVTAPAAPAPSATYPDIAVSLLSMGGGDNFYGRGRVASTTAKPPFTIHYFINLQKAAELPPDVEGVLFGYLYALLDIPNNRRARESALAIGMQGDFPSDEELKQRKDALEADMEESQSIIPCAAVY